ncbi:MAG: hypothetical protein NTV86_16040 [Planctomycetota bacterium]|nr:hypothetical protein [Planctomycetota bacterium]
MKRTISLAALCLFLAALAALAPARADDVYDRDSPFNGGMKTPAPPGRSTC